MPVIQLLLGGTGLVSSQAMLSQWRWVVVGATIAAAVLTPSTDPFTQTLLALPLVSGSVCSACLLCRVASPEEMGAEASALCHCNQCCPCQCCCPSMRAVVQIGLYFGGAGAVRLLEQRRAVAAQQQ